MSSVVIIGVGAVGHLAADLLEQHGVVDGEPVQLYRAGRHHEPIERTFDIGLIAASASVQDELVDRWRGRCGTLITTSDDPDATRWLLANRSWWEQRGQTLIVGAAMAPGLSTLLAGRLISRFDEPLEVHVARFGTGGPSCAVHHHRAFRSWSPEWRDGEWVDRAGGSGRELVWFPDPIGGADCYRGGFADPIVMHDAFPAVRRISSRVAATRRDRMTSPLPMLRSPHPEGLVGALRVEVRGRRDGAYVVEAVAATGRPALATAAVAVAAARRTWPAGAWTMGAADADVLDDVSRFGVSLHRFANSM
jgi:saccharopine dehydrogenase-like NADP-dependent oxidoreductase